MSTFASKKNWRTSFIFNSIAICSLLIIFTSCERITFEEHKLNEYDGELNWTQVAKKYDWKKRFDHDATVFGNKIIIAGGYNPGIVKGDPYFEDVWSSEDGITWNQEVEKSSI